MLGSRTKQINAYGRRSKRIIDAPSTGLANSDKTSAQPVQIISIFDDLPPPAPWGSLASKMKQRENSAPSTKPKVTPLLHKVVGLQKKRRLSPILSPVKRKANPRVSELKKDQGTGEDGGIRAKKLNKLSLHTVGDDEDEELPPTQRTPLSPCVLNVPRSPGVANNPRRKTTMPTATPSKLRKTFNPFVDVDITVLDKDGNTLSKERRVSTDKAVSALTSNAPVKKFIRKQAPSPMADSDESDGEADVLPSSRPKRQYARKKIIVSDDDDSDVDYVEPAQEKRARKSIAPKPAKPLTKPLARSRTSTSVVEVVVPPLPYKIARIETNKSTSPPVPSTTPSLPDVTSDNEPSLPELSQDSFQRQRDASMARYNLPPSPPLRPRQLTPIKGGVRRRMYEPPSPPSPTTPTDLDLSLDFSSLDITSLQELQSQTIGFEVPSYLTDLLEECNQTASGPHNFSAFIDTFPFDPILQASRGAGEGLKFRKIGEASYSEVFGIGDVVLKVIPLRDESAKCGAGQHAEEEDGPSPSDAKDVRKEIVVTRAMGEVHQGFVKLLKTYVVKGRYPEVLLGLWDEYNDKYGSESVRPDTFKLSQFYAIIVLPNGGPDLEAFAFSTPTKTGWRQACSIFWQVAKSLAHAENLVSFEHRDLHWGQILVKTTPATSNALKVKPLNTVSGAKGKGATQRPFMDDKSVGVRATVIDLGLSRMDAGDGSGGVNVHWTPFDEEVFEGQGDYQFDVYRMMKNVIKGSWDKFHPITNIIWLHYLLQKLITAKGLKPPLAPRKPKGESATSSTAAKSAPPAPDAPFTEKECYECLLDLEQWLAQAVARAAAPSTRGNAPAAAAAPRKQGKPRKVVEPSTSTSTSAGPVRAGEVVAYGAKRGWIKASTPFR